MQLPTSKFRSVHLWIFLLILFLGLLPIGSVQAVDAGNSYMRCDRMKAGVAPGTCLIVFTTSSTTATETTIQLTLDSEWFSTTNFSTTAGNYTVSTTGIPTGTTAMPGINTATTVSGQTITFPITALTNGTTYAFFITGTGLILNPAASTTQLHTIFTHTGSAVADTKLVAVPTITDDQIVITANVDPTFTFVFSNNAQSLGTLSTSSITSGLGTAITITTNAGGGWNAWVASSNAALKSVTTPTKSIPTAGALGGGPSTVVAGTAGYVLDVDKTTDGGAGGTVLIDPEYDGTTIAAGGTLSTTYQPIATANGPAGSDVITLIPRVAISGLTPAGSDYTDTLTVVGAGIF